MDRPFLVIMHEQVLNGRMLVYRSRVDQQFTVQGDCLGSAKRVAKTEIVKRGFKILSLNIQDKKTLRALVQQPTLATDTKPRVTYASVGGRAPKRLPMNNAGRRR